MSGDWKPGDVAMVGGKWAPLKVRVFGFDMVGDGRWSEGHGGFVRAEEATEVRALVVIDPEDAEQVERLRDLMWAEFERGLRVAFCKKDMRPALREFANPTPPKPAEPQGLGAVVEANVEYDDGKGWGPGHWSLTEDGSWVCLTDGHAGSKLPWGFLSDVRVLFAGISTTDLGGE